MRDFDYFFVAFIPCLGINMYALPDFGTAFFFGSGFFLGMSLAIYVYEEMHKSNIYFQALKIFFMWKKEIGGVSLKGVGQHYENWIQKKISETSGESTNDAQYKTKK